MQMIYILEQKKRKNLYLTCKEIVIKEESSQNIYFINGEINGETSSNLIKHIIESNKVRPNKHINVMINSEGGDVHEGFAIVDMMNSSQSCVKTFGIGVVASSALFILMSGTKGHRYAFPNTIFMSHQWSGTFDGKEHEINSWNKYNDSLSKKMFNLYLDKLNCPAIVIKKKLLGPTDYYFTPQEALKLGFIDKIITDLKYF